MTGIHRRRKRATTTDSYAGMLRRMIKSYGDRIADSPEAGLAHLRELEAGLTDAVNAGIYGAHLAGHSYNELAGLLDVSKAAIIKRAKLGEAVVQDRERQRVKAARAELAARVASPRELPPGQ